MTNYSTSTMRVVLWLIVAVSVIVDNKVHCTVNIKCYSCSSMYNESCLKPYKNRIPLKRCDLTQLNETQQYAARIDSDFSKIFQVDMVHHDPQVPMNCLKQVNIVGNRKYVLRGCQLALTESSDICVKIGKIKRDTLKTPHCSLCNTDGCNGTWRPGNDVLTIIVAIVAALCRI